MNNYKDFKKLSLYTTYIKNVKWNFNFMKEKICASTELNYRIYESKMLFKEVYNFNNYRECFINLINEIKTLNLCKTCNRLDDNFCKKCEIENMIDEITLEEMNEEECPICYKKLSIRYVHICSDVRHKICNKCYSNLEMNIDVLCPICRQTDEEV
tara:strand:- start:2226 stop:2693 length:468 start_codon:yes stop_codon:yes gene_type:complete